MSAESAQRACAFCGATDCDPRMLRQPTVEEDRWVHCDVSACLVHLRSRMDRQDKIIATLRDRTVGLTRLR